MEAPSRFCAASYVQTQANSKVRLFNLSPDTKLAGMACSGNGAYQSRPSATQDHTTAIRADCNTVQSYNSNQQDAACIELIACRCDRLSINRLGTKQLVSGVAYSLGSPWVTVSSSSATYSFTDDGSSKPLVSKTVRTKRQPLLIEQACRIS